MLDPFVLRAVFAALGAALVASLLGCFVVWRRLAYFGDATSHAAILGVAIALFASVHVVFGVAFLALVMALALFAMSRDGSDPGVTLGVLSHGALALGIVALMVLPTRAAPLEAYLFGDVFLVAPAEVWLIWIGGAAVVGAVFWHWNALIVATLNPDLAVSLGVSARRMELLIVLLLAAVVALSLKVVGALLISALLIMPAATARELAKTPEGMALWSAVLAAVASMIGFWAAFQIDAPIGPSIVVVAGLMFAAAKIFAR